MGNKEVSTNELYDLIKGLVESNKEIKEQISQTSDDIKAELTTVRKDLAKELHQIKLVNEKLKQENSVLKEKLQKVEKTLKKYSLVIYNLKEQENNSADLQKFVDILRTSAEVSCTIKDFRDFFRFGKKDNIKVRPASVEVGSLFLKEEILKKSYQLKDQNIYIYISGLYKRRV